MRWWGSIGLGVPHPYARAFIADEYDRDLERVHVHALLYSDLRIHQHRVWGSWQKYWGRERILKFNKHLGASFYCAKYLLKESQDRAEWRFVEWHEGKVSDGSEIESIAP